VALALATGYEFNKDTDLRTQPDLRTSATLLFFLRGGSRVTGPVSWLGRRGPQKPGTKKTVSRAFLGLRPIARVFACVEFWHCRLHALLKDLSSEFILRVGGSACRKGLNLILQQGSNLILR
jgi:hypothetical protein